MAFEADCNVSTVLEALRVARTARPLVLAARRLWASGGGWKLGDGKSEIRNPKFLATEAGEETSPTVVDSGVRGRPKRRRESLCR